MLWWEGADEGVAGVGWERMMGDGGVEGKGWCGVGMKGGGGGKREKCVVEK